MGVEKEKHKIELKDMNFYVNKLTPWICSNFSSNSTIKFLNI